MRKKYLLSIIIVLVLLISGCTTKVTPSAVNNSDSPKGNETIQDNKKNTTVKGKFELEEVTLFADKAKVMIPKGFALMSEEMAKLKYPSEHRPQIIYTNDKGSINVAFSYTTTNMKEEEIDKYKNQMKKLFNNSYPSAKWYNEGTFELNNKKVGYLELLTPAIDTKVYNLMFFSTMNKRLLIGSFNCTEKEMEDWKPTALEIMNSLKIT